MDKIIPRHICRISLPNCTYAISSHFNVIANQTVNVIAIFSLVQTWQWMHQGELVLH